MTRHRRGHLGRHRLGRPGLFHCALMPAVRLRMAWRATGWRPVHHRPGHIVLVPVVAPRPTGPVPAAAVVRTRPDWSASDRLAA